MNTSTPLIEANTNELIARLFARVSQELRNPLNTLSAMLGLLAETASQPEQQDYLEAAQQNNYYLRRLMNNLLELSKFEQNQFTIAPQVIYLSEWLEEVIENVAQVTTVEQVHLIYYLNPDVPTQILSDALKLRYVLDNLLYEAVKSNQSGEILLTVDHQTTETARLMLHFSLKGGQFNLPPNDHKPWWDAPQTSLGLIAAKRTMDLLGGKLWLENWSDQDAILHGTLPVDLPTITDNETALPEADLTILQGKQVLLVVSNNTLRRVLSRLLRIWGLNSQDFATGGEILAWLADGSSCQAILLDPDLTDMDGVTLAQTIRQHTAMANVPLILLTRKLKQTTSSTVTALYLTKPVRYTQLQAMLLDLFTSLSAMNSTPTTISTIDSTFAEKYPLNILLAEQNHVNQKVVKRLLERMGYVSHVVTTGLDATKAFQDKDYDILLFSLNLPDMEGLALVAQLRQSLPRHRQPYIIVMVTESPCHRAPYLAQNIDDCLSKPIRLNDLATVLSHYTPNKLLSPVSVPKPTPNLTLLNLPIIDLSQLKLLIGEYEREMISEFTDMFMVETPKQLAKMHQSFAENDMVTLQRAVHTLKSSSATFGAMRLAYLCKQLELQLIKGTVIEVDSKVREIETAYQEAEIILKQIVQE